MYWTLKMLNAINQVNKSSDSVFHIVDRGKGDIEIVRLEPIRKVPQIWKPTPNCTCVMCSPTYSESRARGDEVEINEDDMMETYIEADETTEELTIIPDRDETQLECNGTIGNDDTSVQDIAIKIEPELEIVDVDVEKSENHQINLAAKQQLAAADIFHDRPESVAKDEVTDDKLKMITKRLPSSLTVRKISKKTNAESRQSMKVYSKVISLDFSTKHIKCNLCEMVFPVNSENPKMLKTHFLLHKNSVKRDFKCEKCDKQFFNMDYLMILRHKKSHEQKDEISTIRNFLSFNKSRPMVRSYSSTGRRYLAEPVKLKRILDADKMVVENIKETDPLGGDDNDDDIQIVEQKPELIVIDDNDDHKVIPSIKLVNIRKLKVIKDESDDDAKTPVLKVRKLDTAGDNEKTSTTLPKDDDEAKTPTLLKSRRLDTSGDSEKTSTPLVKVKVVNSKTPTLLKVRKLDTACDNEKTSITLPKVKEEDDDEAKTPTLLKCRKLDTSGDNEKTSTTLVKVKVVKTNTPTLLKIRKLDTAGDNETTSTALGKIREANDDNTQTQTLLKSRKQDSADDKEKTSMTLAEVKEVVDDKVKIPTLLKVVKLAKVNNKMKAPVLIEVKKQDKDDDQGKPTPLKLKKLRKRFKKHSTAK